MMIYKVVIKSSHGPSVFRGCEEKRSIETGHNKKNQENVEKKGRELLIFP